MSEISKRIGKLIYLRRKELGLSQAALGDRLDITFQQIQKYESGKNTMSVVRVIEMAEALRVPVEYFFKPTSVDRYGFRDAASERESLEMMKAFGSIKSRVTRRSISDMVRAVAGGQK